jgi:hypothetical protein
LRNITKILAPFHLWVFLGGRKEGYIQLPSSSFSVAMLLFSLNVLIDRFVLITGPSTSVTCNLVSRNLTNKKMHAPRINNSGVPNPKATPIPICPKPESSGRASEVSLPLELFPRSEVEFAECKAAAVGSTRGEDGRPDARGNDREEGKTLVLARAWRVLSSVDSDSDETPAFQVAVAAKESYTTVNWPCPLLQHA